MADLPNPYAPPRVDVGASALDAGVPLDDAPLGVRFVNFLVDMVAAFVVMFVVGVVLTLAGVRFDEGWVSTVVPNVTLVAYYVLLEGLSGRTLGKLITRSRVVARDGGAPGFGQILGRTLARLVPFEPFSFLGGAPSGWHDRWSGTRVVRLR